MKFRYYHGSQAEQFSFVRIPRIILVGKEFQMLSIAAKMLYGVLLDRMSLSMKNRWMDEENRVYIIYPIDEIRETLGFSKKKAVDLLAELEEFGLLEKKRRGLGLPNILYVKSFLPEGESSCGSDGDAESRNSDAFMLRSAETDTSGSSGIDTSRSSEITLLEDPKAVPLINKTDSNNTNMSYQSNHIVSTLEEVEHTSLDENKKQDPMRYDETDARNKGAERREVHIFASESSPELSLQLIRENISFDDLMTAHEEDRDLIRGIEGLIFETVLSKQKDILIACNRYPAQVVKSRFLKLNFAHIEYVLFCLHRNTSKVKNIRKYLLAALFNAPQTMTGFFQAETNSHMNAIHQDDGKINWGPPDG